MRILIIQGHPEVAAKSYNHALADAYATGARAAGHEVRIIDTGEASAVRAPGAWFSNPPADWVSEAHEHMRWAEHWVIVFPMWNAGMPAALAAWVEQVFRPGFNAEVHRWSWTPLLKGRSARIIATMGAPVLFYTFWNWQAGLSRLRRSVLRYAGIRPIRQTLIGRVNDLSDDQRAAWLRCAETLGRRGR